MYAQGVETGTKGVKTLDDMSPQERAWQEKIDAGIKMEPIAYKGGAQGVTAVIGGEIEIMITQPNTGLPYVKSGRVRAIATTGAKRSTTYPDTETLVEAGYKVYAVDRPGQGNDHRTGVVVGFEDLSPDFF